MANALKRFLRWDNLRLHVSIARHAVDLPVARHHHDDFLELVFVREGRAVHLVGESAMPVAAGSLFLIRELVDHEYLEPEDMVIYNILLDRDFLRYFDADLRNLPNYQLILNLERSRDTNQLRLEDRFFPEVVRLLDEVVAEQKSEVPGARTLVLANVLRVFGIVFRHAQPTDGSRALRHTHSYRISRLLATLESRYRESWSLEKMAACAGMSPVNFRLEFKRLTGSSPIRHLVRTRLNQASLMLMLPGRGIGEIARACGFADSNYFTRQFRAEFGLTPRQFRRQP